MSVFNSEVVIKENHKNDDFKSYYVGYVNNEYDWDNLLNVMFDALIEFVYGCSRDAFDKKNIAITLQKAISRLIKKNKYAIKRTGDVGELLLHIILRDFFDTIPLVQKIHLKSSSEDAAKSFDIVHIKEIDDKINLVLGEAKLYSNPNSAVTSLLDDVKKHYNQNFLQTEFVTISGQIPDHKLLPDDLDNLFCKMRNKFNSIMPSIIKAQSTNSYLETIFDDTILVLFCAFKANTCAKYKKVTKKFISEINQDLESIYKAFKAKNNCTSGKIVFILFPLLDHDELIDKFLYRMRSKFGNI